MVKKIVTDDEGKFYLLLTPGAYKVTVEERIGVDVYNLVRTIDEISLPRGIFTKDIIVAKETAPVSTTLQAS